MSRSSSLTNTEQIVSASARLRRLKIQESVLLSSVNKMLQIFKHNEISTKSQMNNEFKKYLTEIRDYYVEIKNLLEDVKISTNSTEQLDINEIKRDIFDLEAKMKSYRMYLQTELVALRNHAHEIQNELTSNQLEENQVRNKVPKLQAKQFTEIVPSPVRVIINSPFKCPEVQQFQEFVMNDRNRFGGWNEYNHNMFVQIWKKHFRTNNDEISMNLDNSSDAALRFQSFNDDVLEKIPGTPIEHIISHSKWYSKFLHLKNCQKRALEKWQENKRKIRKTKHQTKQELRSKRSTSSHVDRTSLRKQVTYKDEFRYPERPVHDSSGLKGNTDDINSDVPTNHLNKCINNHKSWSRIVKPTEQWKNRCAGKNDPSHLVDNTNNKRQLQIPSWRWGLNENGNREEK